MSLKNRIERLETRRQRPAGNPIVFVKNDGSGFECGGKLFQHFGEIPAPPGRGFLLIPDRHKTPESWFRAVAKAAEQRPDSNLWREAWPELTHYGKESEDEKTTTE